MQAGSKIIVIGDSHACFWNGRDSIDEGPSNDPNLTVRWLGPATAFGLKRFREIGTFGDAALTIVRENKYSAASFIFTFGEIDCRCHLVRLAESQKEDFDHAINNAVSSYLEFLHEVRAISSAPIVIWGPPATSPISESANAFNNDWPFIGSEQSRNLATEKFILLLRLRISTISNIGFISIFDLMCSDALRTRPGFHYDGVHIRSSYLSLAKRYLSNAFADMGRLDLSLRFLREVGDGRVRNRHAATVVYTAIDRSLTVRFAPTLKDVKIIERTCTSLILDVESIRHLSTLSVATRAGTPPRPIGLQAKTDPNGQFEDFLSKGGGPAPFRFLKVHIRDVAVARSDSLMLLTNELALSSPPIV